METNNQNEETKKKSGDSPMTGDPRSSEGKVSYGGTTDETAESGKKQNERSPAGQQDDTQDAENSVED
ncbi:hypothetical protein [Arcticibacter sp. MXS-1]|uniref:hypothetical protein n=1 Tax=Arcticibacter sp. MXS-1 TaxID=3341726 RepID=UPI0035A91D17